MKEFYKKRGLPVPSNIGKLCLIIKNYVQGFFYIEKEVQEYTRGKIVNNKKRCWNAEKGKCQSVCDNPLPTFATLT